MNPTATSIHLVDIVNDAKRRGAFLAVIDPRRTPLARRADLHLQPLPGTDTVLALAVAQELIRSRRVDHAFLARWVNGFAALAEAAEPYSLARAADICQVPERDIAAFTDAYAAASPAVIRCGWGIERNRNGGNAARVIFSLPAVAGKFGVRGGGLTMSLSRTFPIDARALSRPDLQERPVRRINMTQLGQALTEPQQPPLRALFVYNANPVAVTPNQNLILRGLSRPDLFTVVHDQVMTDTARFADIVLPATTVFEQADLYKSYGHYSLQYAAPLIAPVGESKTNGELFGLLARALGFTEPALVEPPRALLEAALQNAGGRLDVKSLDDLIERGSAQVQFQGQAELIQFVTDFPRTASGRIEVDAAELGPIRFVAPPASKFPLQLISPATEKTINSIFGEFNLPSLVLQLNRRDATQRGIADRDAVRVYNDLGEVHVRVRVSDEVRAGIAVLPKGAWQSSTLNGSTVTALVPDHLSDIGAGACFNDARVEVERLA